MAARTSPDSVARLRSIFTNLQLDRAGHAASNTEPHLSPLPWHAAAANDVLAVIPDASPIVKRAATRLWPGPVTLVIELSEKSLAGVRAHLGTHAADDGRSLWVRVPDHTTARDFITRNGPILARGVPDTAAGSGLCPTIADARARLTGAGVARTEIPGPDGSGLPSTLVRLPRSGGFRIERTGAMSADSVRNRLTLHLLFVCTGNTCRSPMAERIARHLAERRAPGSVPIEVASAGVTAAPGEPTTPEALEAVRRQGIETRPSGARPLDPAAIRWADEVYTMTSSHLREAHRLGARSARLLDPKGGDVPDPIGGTQRQYDDTARRLAELIAARLQEFSA